MAAVAPPPASPEGCPPWATPTQLGGPGRQDRGRGAEPGRAEPDPFRPRSKQSYANTRRMFDPLPAITTTARVRHPPPSFHWPFFPLPPPSIFPRTSLLAVPFPSPAVIAAAGPLDVVKYVGIKNEFNASLVPAGTARPGTAQHGTAGRSI